MGLQSQYDLDIAQDQLGKRLEREVRPYAMAKQETESDLMDRSLFLCPLPTGKAVFTR